MHNKRRNEEYIEDVQMVQPVKRKKKKKKKKEKTIFSILLDAACNICYCDVFSSF